MIPYVEHPSASLGPITIHAFGVVVALALVVGVRLGERRFERVGLDCATGERLVWWIVGGGFLGAHLFAVLLYFPRQVLEDPLVLLRVWDHISSFGGMLGGAIGLWAFFNWKARDVPAATRMRYLDAVAFVFPVALLVGRLGCALAHDHPGSLTRSPLAISAETPAAQALIATVYVRAGRGWEIPPADALATLGFHDLGLYEFLYLALLVVPATLLLARRPRAPGFFLATFVLLYMPARFLLDFLRVGDATYAGLTPAQWVALLSLVGLAAMRLRASLRSPWLWLLLAGGAVACGSRSV